MSAILDRFSTIECLMSCMYYDLSDDLGFYRLERGGI